MSNRFEIHKTDKEEWLTPPELIKSLGQFDLDPCSPINRPWPTALTHYTINDDGLSKSWNGRVFCNPPYGKKTWLWAKRMSEHNNGILLIFARTDTTNFHKYILHQSDAIMFLKGRLTFYNSDGTPAKNSAGAPSLLAAYGLNNVTALHNSHLNGFVVELKKF